MSVAASAAVSTPWTILEDALRLANDPRTSRVAVVLHGGPGAGKSWVRERMDFAPGELAVVIDSDVEKKTLARHDGESDSSYHARARDASRERMEWAIARGAPLYIEGLSHDPRRTILVLTALRDAGYHVVMVGLECSPDVAGARLRAREESDLRSEPQIRTVASEIVRDAYLWIPRSWTRLRQLIDELYLFDTSGDEPVPCEPIANLAPIDPPKSLREALGSMLPKPYAELADLAVRLSHAVGASGRSTR